MYCSKAFTVARLSMTAVIGDCDVCHHLTHQAAGAYPTAPYSTHQAAGAEAGAG